MSRWVNVAHHLPETDASLTFEDNGYAKWVTVVACLSDGAYETVKRTIHYGYKWESPVWRWVLREDLFEVSVVGWMPFPKFPFVMNECC